MKQRLVYIELLRVISTLSVVVFHVNGMFVYKIPQISRIPSFNEFQYGVSLCTGIGVATFMFISGFLYKEIEANQRLNFIKKKAIRLLLPYTLFSILIMSSSGFFSLTEFVGGGFWHLWFLTALFWCFVVALCVDFNRKRYAVLALCCSVCVVPLELPEFLGLQNFCSWFYYFAMGATIRRFPVVCDKVRQLYLWIPLCVLSLLIFVEAPFCYRVPSVIHTIAISSFVVAFWALLSITKFRSCWVVDAIQSVACCSMGIYVLHYWLLIYLISTTSIKIFNLEILVQDYPILVVIFVSFIAFLMAYTISYGLRNFRIGRLIIG